MIVFLCHSVAKPHFDWYQITQLDDDDIRIWTGSSEYFSWNSQNSEKCYSLIIFCTLLSRQLRKRLQDIVWGRLLRVNFIKPVLVSICLSVCPSTKSFSDSNKIWCPDEWYTTVFCVTWCKVNVKVMEVRKLRKWWISNSVSSADRRAIKRLIVNYDSPKRCVSKLFLNRFLIFILIWHHVTFKVKVLWEFCIGLFFVLLHKLNLRSAKR